MSIQGWFRGFALFLALVPASAGAAPDAGPRDGFVLTQWGHWTLSEATEALDGAARAGARNISVLVHMCQSSRSSSDIHWCDAQPGQPLLTTYQGERLLKLLPEIRARGMSFNFIPFPGADGLESRSWIWPGDRPAWFRNYGALMEELAILSQHEGAASLIVGSELTLLFSDGEAWREVIARVRRFYEGHLTISPVFPQYPMITFWDALDSIGVSAYFPLSVSDSISPVWLLEASWQAHKTALLAYAAAWGKPLTFVEVGYPTTEVAATRPWDYAFTSRKLDEELPRRCWEAFRRVWGSEPRLRAFQIWGLSGQPYEAQRGFSPIGKPAEAEVRALFRERSAL